ncbi:MULTISPECIES: tripartite tricarboxylate transporter permease [Devosia]|uniref:tripartite tricarboxylate transporter permease n=1 Tax=Devosia TaxID=46913 RepID=UPI000CE9A2F2|nr:MULTISPECIES: tripartite tricarboxylate transporter permease [Devosia]AVF04343.1 C4-dicarboxylate ABC transporter permease [Devosia sp. I507]
MDIVIETLGAVFALKPFLALVMGVVLGIFIGALPGISATMGVALVLPFTYGLDPMSALGLLAGIHNGASQGGAIPSILLRIPGTPGSVVTTWDGYPLARRGDAGAAIQLAAVSSAVGGMIGAATLGIVGPSLAAVTLSFGPPEMFSIAIFGLICVSVLMGPDLLKGLLAALLGLLLATVGFDDVTGYERFSFGIPQLAPGLSELAVMIGLFSLPPAWEIARSLEGSAQLDSVKIVVRKGVWTVRQVWRSWVRASAIGVGLGVLPGSSVGAFLAYAAEKAASKEPETFGKGSVQGLAAAESVNNADNAAAMIPALTLGIPGSAIAAMMLGALVIQGLQPGPQLFRTNPTIVYGYTLQMFVGALLLIVLGGAMASKVYSQVLRLPQTMIMFMVIAMTALGAYASANEMFPVWVAFGFGLVGITLRRLGFPVVPIIIGLVLGKQIEFNYQVSTMMGDGSPAILLQRPVSAAILVAAAALLLFLGARRISKWRSAT